MHFLVALVAAFSIGHVFRTLPAALAPSLTQDLALDGWALGLYGGAFNVVFAAMQLPIGHALDRVALRALVSILLVAAALGAALTAAAGSLATLLVAQGLLGIGCSGLWLACCVHVARIRPQAAFAWITTLCAAAGSSGMFLTGTPLALAILGFGWRAAMLAIAIATLALLLMVLLTPAPGGTRPPPRAAGAPRAGFVALLAQPRIRAGVLLGLVSYGCLLAIRGLWVGPYLEHAQGLTATTAGHVALLVSAVMIAAPLAFGQADRRGVARAPLLGGGFAIAAASLLALGLGAPGPVAATVLLVVFAAGASAFVLQYADIRAAAPPGQEGRALSLLNLAFLIGVAGCQIGGGALLAALPATLAPAAAQGAVMVAMGALLLGAALLFLVLTRAAQRGIGASRR
jgi:predicted MFS family arabinose efflux permease